MNGCYVASLLLLLIVPPLDHWNIMAFFCVEVPASNRPRRDATVSVCSDDDDSDDTDVVTAVVDDVDDGMSAPSA